MGHPRPGAKTKVRKGGTHLRHGGTQTGRHGGSLQATPAEEQPQRLNRLESQDRGSKLPHPDPRQVGHEPPVISGACHKHPQADPHHCLLGHGSRLPVPDTR